MTALSVHPAAPTRLVPRRVVAGAVVASAGVVAFSVAVGSFVVGSSHRFAGSTAAQASALLAETPLFVIAGLVHLAVAIALLAGNRAMRAVALVATVGATIMALAQAAMLLTGIDPTGGPRAGHPTTQGVAILLIAAAAYGFAALAASDAARD